VFLSKWKCQLCDVEISKIKFMKKFKINLFKPILFGLAMTLIGNQGISQVTNTGSNDMPMSQYIDQSKAHFENLSNQGVNLDSLHSYKEYNRLINYYSSTGGFPDLSIKQIADEFNNWSKANETEWQCVINNQYPYLTFSEVGPSINTTGGSQGTGQIHFIEFDYSVVNDQKMFVCSNYSGLFVSQNGGQNWANAGTDHGLPSVGVSSVALSINSPSNTWYISTGQGEMYDGVRKPGIGIWRTKNAGQTYERISLSNSDLDGAIRHRKIICLNGNNGSMRLIVASKNGLFMTENGDASYPTWTKIANGEFYDVEVQPGNQDVIIASGDVNTPLIKYDFSNGSPDTPLNPTVLHNLDMNFNLLTTNPNYSRGKEFRRTSIEFCGALANNFVVMVTEKSETNSITSRTNMYTYDLITDALTHRGELLGGGGLGVQAGIGIARGMAWAVSPGLVNGEIILVYGNAYSPIRQTNFTFDGSPIIGTDWIDIGTVYQTHPDMHFMKFNQSSSILYIGNDGGVFKTQMSNPQANWVNLNTGLGVSTVLDVSTSQNGNREIVGSFQDMGNIVIDKNTNNQWVPRNFNGGDGTHDMIHNIYSDKFAVGNNSTNIRYKSNYGTTSNSSASLAPSVWDKQFEGNSIDNNTIYSVTLDGVRKHIYGTGTAIPYSDLPIEPNITTGNGYSNPQAIRTLKTCENPKYSDYIYVVWVGGLDVVDPDGVDGPLEMPDIISPRIYRTTTGGGTNSDDWELVLDSGVPDFSKIAVSFTNPNVFWYGAFEQLYKVVVNSPTDVSVSLPMEGIPTIAYSGIKDICYVNGSDDAIYIANKHGLYYTDNVNYNGTFQKICSLPNAEVTDIEIDYCRKKIVVSTYGRGIWEANLDLPQPKPYTVNSGETITITGDYYAGTNIIIEPNATLIVEGTLYMPKDSKIDVMPAGDLRVINGTITNGCDVFWDGISVWGDHSDQTQSFSIQGHATFNNAIIEHANVAVRNYGTNDNGSVNWASRGGIIQATETQFLNNRRDAGFQSYQRTWSNGDLVNDRSNFRDVVFKTTDDFRHPNTMNHVTMYKTYGIRFTGCDFIDDRDANFNSTWINGTNAHNCGIRSVDAKYTVSGKCLSGNISNCNGDLSSGNWEPTTFTNLDFGIYASNASTENNITVDRCEFTNNLYGVELVKSNSPTVTRSHFKYNNSNKYLNANLNNPDANSPHGYLHGIHALVLSEMRIEENLFINNGAVNNTYGIICSHLGESGEQTYLNRFENLTVASLTQGKNRSVDPNGIYHGIYGLQFLCNKNISNIQDHKVLGTLWSDEDALNYTSNTYGVRSNNGGDNFKSGVEFTQNSASVEDYENFSTNNIKFYYDLNGVNEKPEQISSNVAALPSTFNSSVTCSSNLTSKPIKLLPVLVKSQLISDFNTTSANLVIAKQSYEALLDCGDTDGLMFLIDNLNSNTKSVLRQELLNCSPYVTTDIIKATIDNKETYYPNAWCLELILANIDVVRERNFMQFLTDKTNPMPAWMIQTLNWYVVNGYSLTPKAIKELEISDLSYKRNYASDMIIRDFKNDTTGTNLDSVKFWIEQKADIDAQVRLIDIALQKNDVTTAQAKLNVLNADILNYPTHLQSEIQDVVTFKTEVISILGNTGGLANMTENNHMFMTNMATNSEGIAKVQAQELLCFFFDECVEYSFDIPMKARAMAVDKPTVTKPELNFKLFPNPASDWVTIELPLDVAPVIVTITDLQGKLILNTTVNRPIYIWETDQLPNGVYLINIKTEVGGYDLGTEKVTIQH
jgi:hypothetical protein